MIWMEKTTWEDVWEIFKPGIIIGSILGVLALVGLGTFFVATQRLAAAQSARLDQEQQQLVADQLQRRYAELGVCVQELRNMEASEDFDKKLYAAKRAELDKLVKRYNKRRLQEQARGNWACDNLLCFENPYKK